MMEEYAVMCPACGTLIFKEKQAETTRLVECDLCKRTFLPQETFQGLTAEQLVFSVA